MGWFSFLKKFWLQEVSVFQRTWFKMKQSLKTNHFLMNFPVLKGCISQTSCEETIFTGQSFILWFDIGGQELAGVSQVPGSR